MVDAVLRRGPSERTSTQALTPGTEARFYESEDGSTVRIMATAAGTPILPT
jgi:hypothetical protein